MGALRSSSSAVPLPLEPIPRAFGAIESLCDWPSAKPPWRAPAWTESVRLAQVRLRTNVRSVGIDAQTEELFGRAIEQTSFRLPMAETRFIRIVRRREILEFCAGVFRDEREFFDPEMR